MQAQQLSLCDMGKSTFPLSGRFPVGFKFPLKWRRRCKIEGETWRARGTDLQKVLLSVYQHKPLSVACLTHRAVKPFPWCSKAETSSIPLNYSQHHPTAVSAVALSNCSQCSSPTSPSSVMGRLSCRSGSSTSQSQVLT